jgi:hypothetical protein
VQMYLKVPKGQAIPSLGRDHSGENFEERRGNFVDRFVYTFHSIESLVSKTRESQYGTWRSKGRKIAPSGVRIPAWGMSINSVRC